AFEAETGYKIDGTFSAVGIMRDALLAGEPADLMILSPALSDEIAKSGHFGASSVFDITKVLTPIPVRPGDPPRAVGTARGLRAALGAADAIHFPDPAQATAGIHFAKVINELGLSQEVDRRLRLAPTGATAMRELAKSEAIRPIGCTQETE